jgi:RNA-binding protein
MKKAGKLLHVTPSGGVGRFEVEPKVGQPVFGRDGKRVGNVIDIFGPVQRPYVKIKPASGVRLEDLVGRYLFI